MARDFSVRPATPDDVTGIQRVACTTWRVTYRGKIPDPDIEQFLAGAYSEESICRSVERLGSSYLVAVAGRDVIGYAFAGRNSDNECELFAIYVLPDWQGRGVGRALWEAARRSLAARGCDEMQVWVLDPDEQARNFYERQGAKVIGDRSFPVGEGEIVEIGYRVQIDN